MTRVFEGARRRLLAAGTLAAFAALAGAAHAQATYPDKPITIVVPFSPGSATDTSARIISEKLGPRLNVPIVIENKPGASGTIGASFAARAQADGYTLILTSSSTHSATPALFRKLPFDPTGDFIHVIRIATIPMMLVVRDDAPYKSAEELVKATQAKPLNYAYGSPTSQIAGATFNTVAGAAAAGVPYKSQPPAVTDLLGGHVDYLFADLSVVTSFMQGGKLRGLAFTGQTRAKDFPDVPTLAELGYRNFDLVVWVGVAAPKGTPDEVVQRVNREVAAVLAEPDVMQRFESLGMQVLPNSVAEHQEFALAQRKVWTQRAVDAKIEPQ
ncbi:Bug family tripartite tricarboxylate transporter substrate binding protein [Bordetella bronchiseptica]|uniref:Bug family tripartite tricarboxylate transporter substrate binding protein n=1 Tax=Bordetella bronchiseptica TaxID=518 RepID=UPI00028B58F8|nr:tripartite tricarboxylate transporter substrate binding protein [Bordetella bronchiseptica]KCV30166.1 tripartite tricarboxylate transporter family receptor [Bordetella bronchiseptica 00-P-2730]KDD53054.1 tripartite tricarboxylate transporter family receptor [Bordetella bronchiseptica OSU553]AUL14339.1 ABC transporter substrate-binding protein [Bordetella bronchiseptica]AWP57430.1 ABC transporter substrate-binding protein [Bordetella bronchiseptica]AWQ04172.1 ABC transporter substrate-bindin